MCEATCRLQESPSELLPMSFTIISPPQAVSRVAAERFANRSHGRRARHQARTPRIQCLHLHDRLGPVSPTAGAIIGLLHPRVSARALAVSETSTLPSSRPRRGLDLTAVCCPNGLGKCWTSTASGT